MKNLIQLIFWASSMQLPTFTIAQNPITAMCKAGAYTIGYEASPTGLFYVIDTISQKKDTLLVASLYHVSPPCKCSDSTAVFLKKDLSAVYLIVFRLQQDGWHLSHYQPLPSEPLHGSLTKDEKYSIMTYNLIDEKHVTVKKSTQKVDGTEKEEIETLFRVNAVLKTLTVEKVSKF